MKHLVFLPIILIQFYSVAQTQPPDLFYDGKVILQNGDTIKGLVCYGIDNFLQIRHDKLAEVYTPEKVISFELIDPAIGHSRQFYSLPFKKNNRHAKPIFVELISKGNITVFSQEKVKEVTYSQSTNRVPPKIHRELVTSYFVVNSNGEIEKINANKKYWYTLMKPKDVVIQDYVKANNLSFDKKYDLKKIIDYYNTLATN